MNSVLFALAAGLILATVQGAREATPRSLYDFKMKDIEGREVPLERFRGKVVLVVNVASRCGLTPQYKGLQELYTKHKDRGLIVLGFPANDFKGQEPGTDKQIQEFCTREYGVTFPMFSKISVLGETEHPLFKWLRASNARPDEPVEWNFAKFLVGRNGVPIARFVPKEPVDSPALREAIEKALAAH